MRYKVEYSPVVDSPGMLPEHFRIFVEVGK